MRLSVQNGTRALVQADTRALNERLTILIMNVTTSSSAECYPAKVATLLVSLVECNSFLNMYTDIFSK